MYTQFIQSEIMNFAKARSTEKALFVYAASQGVHPSHPLQVPWQYFERYAAQGAGTGDCVWSKQKAADPESPGSPIKNGFQCGIDPRFPTLKAGLSCLCNRLLVKAQVSALSEGVGNVSCEIYLTWISHGSLQ